MKHNNLESSPKSQPAAKPGPFLAKVIGHLDPSFMGGLEVEILRPVGNTSSEGQLHQVKYMSPFYGVTGVDYTVKEPDDHNNTQKSYGMWMIPPDPGTTVVIIFIDGDPKRGFWIGCVQDENMNFMVPGLAGTANAVTPKKIDGVVTRSPVSEYNKKSNTTTGDATKFKKPVHPIAAAMETAGLLLDDIRGITTSSARRETPSAVFGISTPGPLDKKGKQGTIGKKEHEIKNAYVSRLGGTTFVMDDGDDKVLRKTPAGKGKPEYVRADQGEKGGDVGIPHNELVRLRTRTGHQILLHNSEDLIYIGNAKGTAWIELTSNGKIDIYAEDSISIHTAQDFNFYAGRDINFEAAKNINMKAGVEMQVEASKDLNIVIGGDGKVTTTGGLDINTKGSNKFTAAGTTEIKSGGNHIESASQIHMNGPGAGAAKTAKQLKIHTLPTEVKGSTINSIMRRVPTHEPYPQHENLDPLKFSASATNRDIDGRTDGTSQTLKEPATLWKIYTSILETFNKVKGGK